MTVKEMEPVTVHARRSHFHCRDFCEHWRRLMQRAAEQSADKIPQLRACVMPCEAKSGLEHGFRKQIVVPSGVTLHGLLQKRENIRDDLQFILHDVNRINLGAREFR